MSPCKVNQKYEMVALLLALVFAQTASAEPWGPWSSNADAPAILAGPDRESGTLNKHDQEPESVAATPFLWLLSFYQKFLGRSIQGRCPMYPTCSQFSVQAIRKHGPFIGIVMTADRLMHEIDEKEFVSQIKVGNRYRFDDSVSNNDFWWYPQ